MELGPFLQNRPSILSEIINEVATNEHDSGAEIRRQPCWVSVDSVISIYNIGNELEVRVVVWNRSFGSGLSDNKPQS